MPMPIMPAPKYLSPSLLRKCLGLDYNKLTHEIVAASSLDTLEFWHAIETAVPKKFPSWGGAILLDRDPHDILKMDGTTVKETYRRWIDGPPVPPAREYRRIYEELKSAILFLICEHLGIHESPSLPPLLKDWIGSQTHEAAQELVRKAAKP